MEPTPQPQTPPPIPYEQWQPALAKFGIEEGERNRNYQLFFKIYRGTDFDKYTEDRYNPRNHTSERGVYYEKTIEGKLNPHGTLKLEGHFFRDGSMYAITATAQLWEQAGLRLPEFTPLHAAATELCSRLNLNLCSYYATTNIKEQHNLQAVINTLSTLQTFHRQMHLLYKTEGQRLADLAEELDKDLYQQK